VVSGLGLPLADALECKGFRVIKTPDVEPGGVAVSRDGSTLLVSDGRSNAIHEFSVADGSRLRVIRVGGRGKGPLQFDCPRQVWIAADDYAFVAEENNDRVQVLTPQRGFHGFIGEGQVAATTGVCANVDVVAVSSSIGGCITVFRRRDGAVLHRFGTQGRGYGQLEYPAGLCFMPGDRHIAVAEEGNNRVSVFTVDGKFVGSVGDGELRNPKGVMSSSCGELVVADWGNDRLALFSARGERVKDIVKGGPVHGSVMHGGVLFVLAEGTVSLVK
jgi:DNA-binding beta-propeller fold protein YncE